MRRLLVLVLLATMLLPLSTDAQKEVFQAGQVVVVDITSKPIRTRPSSGATLVTTVVRGDELTILDSQPVEAEGYVWWNISFAERDATGWLPDSAFSAQPAPDTATTCWTDVQETNLDGIREWTDPPAMVIEPEATYIATLTTSQGTIVIELDAADAPIATNNFFCLANAGYYDGTDFHRISSNFLIQGGDPSGAGTGTPGYVVPSDPTTGEYPAGSIALANAQPDENGSQFFIAVTDLTGRIPGDYPVFGHVVSGQDVVTEISRAPVEPNPRGELSQPIDPIALISVEVAEQEDEVGPPLPPLDATSEIEPSPTPTAEAAPTVSVPATDSTIIELDAKDIAFVPTELTISAADEPVTIRMKNTGAALHNFSIDSLGIHVDVNPGETVDVVIPAGTAPGTYDFYCNVPGHKEAGMVGKLVVTGVSAQVEPTSATSSGNTCKGLETYQSDFEFAMFTAFMADPEATAVLSKWEDPDFDPYGLTSPEYELLSELFAAMAAGLQGITPPSYASVWHSLQVDTMLFSSVLYEDASTSGPYMADFTHNPEYLALESRLPGAVRSAQSCPDFADWAENNSLLGE